MNEISEAKRIILERTGISILYNIIINDEVSYGTFCQFTKTIYIHSEVLNNKELLVTVIYHEFLHLYLQVETKLFYDILIKKYIATYFYYLNKYCFKYQIWSIYPDCDVCCEFKQTNREGLKNQKLLENNKSLSSNYNQFTMLSEFIVHNSDYYFQTNFNDELFNEDILEMNKFVLGLILNNKKSSCN